MGVSFLGLSATHRLSGDEQPRDRGATRQRSTDHLCRQILDALELDLGPSPLAEQHSVADFDVNGDELAALIGTTWPNGNNLPFLRFFLGGIRDDDAATGLLLSFDALDDDVE
jgi:hypothetical protein